MVRNNHGWWWLRILVVISVVSLLEICVTGSSSKNSSEPTSLADIPIKAILKDIKDITSARNSTKYDLKRSIVGVKKHKNYEIVLYEYSSDEEDELKNKEDDFDSDSPSLAQTKSNNKNTDEEDDTDESGLFHKFCLLCMHFIKLQGSIYNSIINQITPPQLQILNPCCLKPQLNPFLKQLAILS